MFARNPLLALAIAAACVFAQDLPSCSQSCLTTAISTAGCSSPCVFSRTNQRSRPHSEHSPSVMTFNASVPALRSRFQPKVAFRVLAQQLINRQPSLSCKIRALRLELPQQPHRKLPPELKKRILWASLLVEHIFIVLQIIPGQHENISNSNSNSYPDSDSNSDSDADSYSRYVSFRRTPLSAMF
jgi:hypothetical protein